MNHRTEDIDTCTCTKQNKLLSAFSSEPSIAEIISFTFAWHMSKTLDLMLTFQQGKNCVDDLPTA